MAGLGGIIIFQLLYIAAIAAIFFLILYFVIRKAVRDGIKDADNDRRRQ